MKFTKNKVVYEQDINNIEGKAEAIVLPESIKEIEDIIKTSDKDIVPRGSGLSFVSGSLPNDSIIIDMSKMNRIIKIDKDRKAIHVQAGITIKELNEILEGYNLELPINPLFSGIRTLGGIIATNSSGDREIKYGRIRNWINSLEIIDGKGNLQEISRGDVSDFAGMEGITGIITSVKLRLTTKKTRTLSIYKSESLEEVIKLNRKLKLDHEVSMIELLGKTLCKLHGLEDKYHLFVEFESSRGNQKNKEYLDFMKLKDKSYYTLASNGFIHLENTKVFMDKFSEFILYLEQNNIPFFCNLGSGVVYFCLRENDPKKQEVLQLTKRIRGKLSDGLGIGLTKKSFLDPTEIKLIRRIKERYDPDYKINRNKVIDFTLVIKEEPKVEIEKIEAAPTEEPEIGGVNQKEDEASRNLGVLSPEEEIEEFIEQEKVDEILHAEPIVEEKIPLTPHKSVFNETEEKPREILNDKEKMYQAIEQNVTLKKEELSEEEKEKIKKIAGGYFG